MFPRCLLAPGFRSSASRFARDEEGSATVWCLLWLLLFVGIAGLAIDSTNAWRVKTGMASTADVAALAGAMDLPPAYLETAYADVDKDTIRTSAQYFAWRNMSPDQNGEFIKPAEDVQVGRWYSGVRKFEIGGEPVNAVMVTLGRNDERDNSVPTTLLRVAGFYDFDVNTDAVAMSSVRTCHAQGIVARETLKITANAEVMNPTCLHGQLGMEISPNSTWWGTDAAGAVSTGLSPSDYTKDRWKVFDGSTSDGSTVDFPDEPNNSVDLYPLLVDAVPTIGYGMIAGWEHFEHFAYPRTEDAGKFILLPDGFNTIAGTRPNETQQTGDAGQASRFAWLDGGVQVASLDGFSSVAGLLGFAAKGGTGSTGTGGGGKPSDAPSWYNDGNEISDGRVTTAEYEEGWKNYNNITWPEDPTVLSGSNLSAAGLLELDYFPSGTTSGEVEEYERYFVNRCSTSGGVGTLTLTGTIRNVTIVTNCKLVIDPDTKVYNSVLLTTAGMGADTSGIVVKNGAVIGEPTECKDTGGVRMYSGGDIYVTGSGDKFNDASLDTDVSTSQFWGGQLVARNDIHFAGKSDSEKGITMQAGGDILIAAQAELAGLELDVDASETETLGNCPKGVTVEWDASAYIATLVH